MNRPASTLAALSAVSSAVWVVFQLGFPWLPLLLFVATILVAIRNRSTR